ncbi:MAG: S1C family serine protease [Candidatus Paceibacteria bacterium]
MSLREYIKSRKRFIITALVFDVITLFFIIVIFGAIIFFNRGAIFDNFASRYIAELQSSQEDNRDKNILTGEALIIDIVEKTNPAVVSIVVTKDIPIFERFFEEINPFGGGFGGFSIRVPRIRQKGTQRQEVGGGSGFFVSKEGLVVTNKHVVTDTDAFFTVLTNDGEQYEARVLARDPFLDIAVMEIMNEENMSFPYLRFGNSRDLKQGQTVIAIGNALGEFRNSVSVGVISGLSRSIVAGSGAGQTELLEEVIQTDAAINRGNSGGPLFDLNGSVIGVNVAVAQGSENIGFSLPSNLIRGVIESVKEYGEIVRPYVGVQYIQINDRVKEEKDLNVNFGILINSDNFPDSPAVFTDSPAQKAGIQAGDIILEIDGVKLDGRRTFGSLVRERVVGETTVLKVLRGETEMFVKVILDKLPDNL